MKSHQKNSNTENFDLPFCVQKIINSTEKEKFTSNKNNFNIEYLLKAKSSVIESKFKMEIQGHQTCHNSIILKGQDRETKEELISKIIIKFTNELKDYRDKVDKKNKDEAKKNEYYSIINAISFELEKLYLNEKVIYVGFLSSHKSLIKARWQELQPDEKIIITYNNYPSLKELSDKIYYGFFLNIQNDIKSSPWTRLMSENLMKFITFQILSCLEFFKKIYFIHCNINLNNLLFTDKNFVKVTDFSCSKFWAKDDIVRVEHFDEIIDKCSQPHEYFQKENYVDRKHAQKYDLFSVGCCLFKLSTHSDYLEGINSIQRPSSNVKMFY
jgi:serine/threonine protein kinase